MADNREILLHLKIWVLQVTYLASKRYKPTHNLAQVGTDKVCSITWVQGIYYEYISLTIYHRLPECSLEFKCNVQNLWKRALSAFLGKRALFCQILQQQSPTTRRWFLLDYSLVTYIQSFIIDLNKNQKYTFDSKSYFIRESNLQDKSLKFDDSVHLKYCLYMTKYGHWRLSLSRS